MLYYRPAALERPEMLSEVLNMKKLILMAALLAWASWSLAQENEAAEGSTPAMPSAEGAIVTIVEPQDGDVVPPTFLVKFMVSGMGLAPAGTKIDNTGHHHLLIDIEDLPPMDQPLPASEQLLHFGGGQTETQLTLAPGKHSLQLVFADYNHRPHNPPVVSEKIVIEVQEGAVPPPEDQE
jgi:hypothetical protein